jgi:hypothetical protein
MRRGEGLEMDEVEVGSGLEVAVGELFKAMYRYREYVKRNYPDRLAGVMWIRMGNELILYSENGKYSDQVCKLTHSYVGDSFSLTEVAEA